jgi:hypothetical protein
MSCCFLDWSAALDTDGIAPLTSLLNDEIDADLIIGADIVSPGISFFVHRDGQPCFQVFDPDLIPPLVAVLRLVLQANSRPRSALVALTTRNPTTMENFTDAVRGTSLPHVLALRLISLQTAVSYWEKWNSRRTLCSWSPWRVEATRTAGSISFELVVNYSNEDMYRRCTRNLQMRSKKTTSEQEIQRGLQGVHEVSLTVPQEVQVQKS